MRRKCVCVILALVTCGLIVGAGCALSSDASSSPPSHDPGVMPLETRSDGAVRLTTPPSGASDQNPAFSPDGSRLVFTRFDKMTESHFLNIVCPAAQAIQFSAILKNRDLDEWRQGCP